MKDDKNVKNVLDHPIDIADPKPWSDLQLHKLSKNSLINKSNERSKIFENLFIWGVVNNCIY